MQSKNKQKERGVKPLDKTVLIEYADMREEIRDLRRRIDADRRALDKLNESIVADTVTRGRKGKKPLGTVTITGIPNVAIGRKKNALNRNIKQLEAFEIDLLELTNQAEEYIDKIGKSELRSMFRFYYIDDLTWEMVALKMNYMFPKRRIAYTKDNCRIRHDRFLEKVL